MKRILVGGCFNIIHPGHIYLLKKAKSYGDCLIVSLTNDFNNHKLYAKPYKERKKEILKLGIVNKVVQGYKKINLKKLIEKIKPDIIVLGYDQISKIDFPNIKRLKKYKNYSSKNYG